MLNLNELLEKQMVKTIKTQVKETTQLDDIVRQWLDSPPSRAEKLRFDHHFLRLKKNIFCKDLMKDTHIASRYQLVIDAMSYDYKYYEILDGGQNHKHSELNTKLWRHFNLLIRKWK